MAYQHIQVPDMGEKITVNEDNKDLLEKPYISFWKDKMLELGGEYMLWSNSPENPTYN